MAKDHYVPRHYLRQFAINGTEEIFWARMSPRKETGTKGVGGVCQEADFYEDNADLEKLLWTSENDFAPLIVEVAKKRDFTEPQRNVLGLMAVNLHLRTKKTAQVSESFPRHAFFDFAKYAIESGRIPPPPGGKWTEDMVECKGAAGFGIHAAAIPCWLEMWSLACKLLTAEAGSSFITSDNPVVCLNQFCAGADPVRTFAGFSRSGFQLLLPISPELCLMFYDAKIYKVGSPRHRLIQISKGDVEIINSFQIQSADQTIFCHDPKLGTRLKSLIAKYENLRIPPKELIRTFSGQNPNEEFVYFGGSSVILPKKWEFCRLRKDLKQKVGDRRDPAWSVMIDKLMDDFEKNPNGGGISKRMNKILDDHFGADTQA